MDTLKVKLVVYDAKQNLAGNNDNVKKVYSVNAMMQASVKCIRTTGKIARIERLKFS